MNLLIEIVKIIGYLFIQPLLYWAVILIFIAGIRRIKHERKNFGYKIFDFYTEWKETLSLSLIFGVVISLATIGIGIVLTPEILLILSGIVILFSLTGRFSLLSPSYTIGATSLVLFLLPYIFTDISLFHQYFSETFIGLVILLSLLLFGESFLYKRVKRNKSFPQLILSDRGIWIGQHLLKKMCLIPFLILIPHGFIEPLFPYWPYFDLGAQSYSVMIFPMILGFEHSIKGSHSEAIAQKLSRATALLAFIVLLLASLSVIANWLSFVALISALLGREYIKYRIHTNDEAAAPYFAPLNEGLKVLSVIPGTPAERLDILVGDTIVKVNNERIYSVNDFYVALQRRGASFKLEIIDDAGEVRFVQSAFYENDHHKLGIVFPNSPYRRTDHSIAN